VLTRRVLGPLSGIFLALALAAALSFSRPFPGPSWWEVSLSVTVKGSYVIEGGETPLRGEFTCRARWAGTIELDENDFLLYHLKTEVLEWRLAEKSGLPKGESLLLAQETSETPRLRLNYVLREGSDLRFDYEFSEVSVPLHASRVKANLEFPRSSGHVALSPGSGYGSGVSRGSNQVVIQGSDLERRAAERTFSWEWQREKRITGNSGTFLLTQRHTAEAVVALIAHGGRVPGLAQWSTSAEKARPLINPALSGAGMELVVNPADQVPADVGVDLGRRDLAVAEHELDRPQVRPPFEQVRREGMAEDMGADLGGEAGLAGVLADEFPQALAGEGLAPS